MLAKRFHLPVQQFSARTAKSFHQNLCMIKIAPNAFSYPRVGVVVGSRVSKGAVKRNKIRRMFFREMQLIIAHPSTKLSGRDILILVKPEATRAEPKEITEEIKNFFTKQNV